ncbi:lysis system i-spanin subunit Rz [Leptospira sp. 96542]|nr:lysis system i-spanin subunit Rz [Leptospira sp. 96542]
MNRLWIGLVAAVALAVLSYWGTAQIYGAGHVSGRAQVQAQWDAQRAETALAHAQELARVRGREAALRGQLEVMDLQHQKDKQYAKAEQDRLLAAVRAGAVRLSVPAAGAACAGAGNADGGAAAASGPTTARTELDAATSGFLVGLVGEGDDAIRDLNTCIDRYNTVRVRLNAAGDVQAQ